MKQVTAVRNVPGIFEKEAQPGSGRVAGTPVETIASGTKMTVKVYYDDSLYATKVDVITEEKTTEEQAAPDQATGWPAGSGK